MSKPIQNVDVGREEELPAAIAEEHGSIDDVPQLGLVAAIAWCFQSQLPQFRRQHALIEEVLAEVRAVRLARGLDVG